MKLEKALQQSGKLMRTQASVPERETEMKVKAVGLGKSQDWACDKSYVSVCAGNKPMEPLHSARACCGPHRPAPVCVLGSREGQGQEESDDSLTLLCKTRIC